MSRRQVTLMDVLLYQLEQEERRIAEEQAEMSKLSADDWQKHMIAGANATRSIGPYEAFDTRVRGGWC